MRNAFAETMTELASKNKNICLLSGDIGNRMFEDFKKVAANRFFNCGMRLIHKLLGYGVMVATCCIHYSFATTRCLEQLK